MAASDATVLLPGATLGMLGGGQLGAMFAIAAKRMGYRVEAISDVADCPAARVCDRLHVGDYADTAFLARAAAGMDVVTFEFENVPAAAGRLLAERLPVRPHPDVLFTTQDRAREKAFLVRHGFACAPHRVVRSRAELQAAVVELGLPAVLKTAAFGYDGKGQAKIAASADVEAAWAALGGGIGIGEILVLEGWIDFDCEISVVAARGLDGSTAAFAPSRNTHADHILDVSSLPAGLPRSVADSATGIAERVLASLGVVGVACVEFFVTKSGDVLVNEIAPRTHNSGHLTIEACETSQFEQQVRAVCGLPLGATRQVAPAAMANLLGDCWFSAGGDRPRQPDWAAALAVPGVRLHLYGKSEPRIGRKMGHLTALADSAAAAIDRVTAARRACCPDRIAPPVPGADAPARTGSTASHPRHGVTLVELIVAAIASLVLMAVLLPGVQAIRESARRAQCGNNLKQIATAVEAHKMMLGHFPTGGWNGTSLLLPGKGADWQQPRGWCYAILPFAEFRMVHESAQTTPTALDTTTPVPFLACPTRRPSSLGPGTMVMTDYAGNRGAWASPAPASNAAADRTTVFGANVGGVAGLPATFDSAKWQTVAQTLNASQFALLGSGTVPTGGVIFAGSAVSSAALRDGASNIYLIAEKYVPQAAYGTGLTPGFSLCAYTGDSSDTLRGGHRPPESDAVAWSPTQEGAFGGPHPQVFMAVMCDGSVRSLGFDIAPDVHFLLACRSDRQAARVPD